ncbi:MAG: cyclic pyranopterin monophosphate synthase MoaC [Proteobacteria bacterium SW_6_67_9]|nr:MAG: cyclic pyranopterin monophosphate synthase MoaC [Proteobacteria bacterium SW_6_67_9]
MSDLSHINSRGEAQVVDVSGKDETHRSALACGHIVMAPATLERIEAGQFGKGDVLGVARTAAVMGAKRTADLVPLCHTVALTNVEVALEPDVGLPGVRCRVTAEALGRTGVEMEALTGVQVALLTVYDMCKAVDRGMAINGVRLLAKRGGRSGTWRAPDADAP